MRSAVNMLLVSFLATSCATGSEPWTFDTWRPDTEDPDRDAPDTSGPDTALDPMDTPPPDVQPDYPEAWDVPDLDISDEALAGYTHVLSSLDTFPMTIPDDHSSGAVSTIEVADTGALSALGVYLAIRHPSRGDLRATLTSPEGTVARLLNHDGGSEDDVLTFFPDLTAPRDDFGRFTYQEVSGTWTLTVIDDYAGNVGQLEDWSLYLTY